MNFSDILASHFLRYPAMQAQDVYKLIHQAAYGPAHGVTNRAEAHHWLEMELENLAEPWPEPPIDPISPDGTLVRVHLAPYLASGGDSDLLLDAFIRTSHAYLPDHDRFESYLITALPLAPGLDQLIETLKSQSYPALHHSDQYRMIYKPAYRVVLEKFLVQ